LTHNVYREVIGKHAQSGRVRYVVKHYPLEAECNPAAAGGNHYASCEAAAGVLMAGAKGLGKKLEDWLFEHLGPPVLTPQQVKDAVRTIGGVTDFDAQYPKVIEQVKADASLGTLLQVDATPTFFINGRRLPKELVQPHYLDVIIQLELDRAAKKTGKTK
jgi:protein-disulfide isomerase